MKCIVGPYLQRKEHAGLTPQSLLIMLLVMSAESEPKGTIKRISEHPFFILSGWLIGIIGVILAICFYKLSISEPELTYFISPTRTPIVQKGNLDNFLLTYKGQQITGNLSTAEIQIWNQGKAPIHKKEIEKPISIRAKNGEPIYLVSTSQTRDFIGLNWLSATNNTKELTFDWNMLEQSKNDGIKIQFIYEGDVNEPLIVDGEIEGQPETIEKYEYTKSNHSVLNYFVIGAWSFSIVVWLFIFFRDYKNKIHTTEGKIILVILAFVASGWLIIMVTLCINIFSHLNKPPFGL